ncbi:MAG TPA: hypothetical protein VH619_00265 [Verrucomicrobiae bacterium]|jgi:hypothetical protein|nr:hypothetical protein [Verrucomicrobiae bacterium]
MNEWNIQSRAHGCQACGKPFADKQPLHTLLFEEKQQYSRLDICAECWAAQYREGANDRKGFISQWQGVFEAPAAAPPDPILKESAESLLRKLIELNNPKHGPVCYILAVMLERKRVLKVKEQIQRDGVRVFIYEHPKTGDIFTIADPNLQMNQLEEVQRDTADLLAHGVNPPPGDPAAPAPAPAPVESVAANSAG